MKQSVWLVYSPSGRAMTLTVAMNRKGAKLFGTWNNGEVIVGSSNVKEIRDTIRKYLKVENEH